jgi:type IV pilus assembly protein PilY1
MIFTRSSMFMKGCASVLATMLALQPLGLYAATTSTLTEVPLQGLNPVKPNIMYTFDESFSMFDEYLPDYVGEDPDKCFLFGFVATCFNGAPPYMSSDFNGMYYNPQIRYPRGKTPDGQDLPAESANPGTWTNVYMDGYAGYPGTNNGGATNLVSGYRDLVWCTKSVPSAAEIATAKTDGSVCRQNGGTYAGISGYRYPDPAFTYFAGVQVFANPYYYTITSVQFCPNLNSTGWGIPGSGSSGACTPQWSPTNHYVSYGTAGSGFDPTAFARVDIVPTTPTYGGRPNRFDCAAAPVCTYAEEMANFANWYAFARSRINAAKTAAGIAFSALDQNSRVGFNTLNTFSTKFLNIQDFTPANKATWFTNLYTLVPTGETPSLDAMWRIGEYFSNRGAAAGLPGATDPLDPATGKCQSNFHLLSTDGYWNQDVVARSGVAGAIDDQDDAVTHGPYPSALEATSGFTLGQPFPLPYREGSGANATSNVMADIAMYYWIHDIRPELPPQVKDTAAPWHHVTFYGLSIGARGTLPYPSGIDLVTTGAAQWPVPSSLNPTAIDDLWHATWNARGKYYNAQNAQQLAEDIVSAISDFTQQSGTNTAVGIAGAQLSAGGSFGYKTGFGPGWSGDVKKYALNPNTGALDLDANGNPITPLIWSAAAQLDSQAAGAGWDTGRRIVTIKDDSIGTPIPFRLANLATSQSNSLANAWATVSPPPTTQQVLNYLRGDQSNEGSGTTNFRIRTHILGDVVNSAAVPVGAPIQSYTDPGYAAFASANRLRTSTVYVGANDGMLHAFDDSTTSNAGKETWAYVPRALFSSVDPNGVNPNASAFQIGALTYRVGGIPLFSHKFYINATPRIWDVDFANTNTSTPPTTDNQWHTILVGGLGAGGRAIYALDVTTPVAFTDTESNIASNHVLWEFTDANLGYVFDSPTLVKTAAYGWVVLVPSGYNNPGGRGFLYVLNPTDGRILQKLSLPGDRGTDANPTGLSTIRAFTANRKNPYVLQAYGGDLNGNVWRFDLSSPDPTNWRTELIAQLTDPRGQPQPITTGVRIEIDQTNGNRYIFIGTGKLLDVQDLTDTSVTNTLYVIRDGTVATPDPAPMTPYSRTNGLTNSVDGTSVSGFSGTLGRGWFQDATDPAQKIITDVTADLQTVVFVFSKPSSDPCVGALSSVLYARNFTTGASELESTGGMIVPSVSDIGAVAGVTLVQGAGASTSTVSNVRAQVTTMSGQVLSFGVRIPGAPNNRHRVSWRLINRD